MYLVIRASMVFGIFSNKKYMRDAIEQYIKDDFDSLCVCLDNQEQVIILNWDGIVESYCRTTEEGRFAFIADEWQKIKNDLSNEDDWEETLKNLVMEEEYNIFCYDKKIRTEFETKKNNDRAK